MRAGWKRNRGGSTFGCDVFLATHRAGDAHGAPLDVEHAPYCLQPSRRGRVREAPVHVVLGALLHHSIAPLHRCPFVHSARDLEGTIARFDWPASINIDSCQLQWLKVDLCSVRRTCAPWGVRRAKLSTSRKSPPRTLSFVVTARLVVTDRGYQLGNGVLELVVELVRLQDSNAPGGVQVVGQATRPRACPSTSSPDTRRCLSLSPPLQAWACKGCCVRVAPEHWTRRLVTHKHKSLPSHAIPRRHEPLLACPAMTSAPTWRQNSAPFTSAYLCTNGNQ